MKEFIKQLDAKENATRRDLIEKQLVALGVSYARQDYASGTNLLVDLGAAGQKIGVSSHFDRVENSAGANDNGSSIAVCLDIIRKYQASASTFGLQVFFFDEEETGLKGSTAYVEKYGIRNLRGLLNMELVGAGDKFALWPVNSAASEQIISTFEETAKRKQVAVERFDQIVTNTADHLPFQKAGLRAAFTVTCISDQDIIAAQHYYQALAQGASRQVLIEILAQAPLFRHYHQPTDTYEKLSEASLVMTSAAIWDTLLALQ